MSLSQFHVEGSSAIVTGASSGIGQSIAERYADDGVNVAICSREQENVDPVAEKIIEEYEGDALAVECDVRDYDQVEKFVDTVVEEFGSVDVLVNNAAGTFRSDFEDLSPNAWGTIIDINLNGTFNCAQAAGHHMRADGCGTIINLASIAALQASPRTSHYASSKAGVISLTESLAVEWADENIQVNCIAPGLIATPPVQERLNLDPDELPSRDDINRQLGRPDEIADVAQFLASRAASFFTGQTLVPRGVPPAPEADIES